MSEQPIQLIDHGFVPMFNGEPVMAYLIECTDGEYHTNTLFDKPITPSERVELIKLSRYAIDKARHERQNIDKSEA